MNSNAEECYNMEYGNFIPNVTVPLNFRRQSGIITGETVSGGDCGISSWRVDQETANFIWKTTASLFHQGG